MSPELYLRSVNQLDTADAEMRNINVCQEGIDIMLPKMRHFVFMVRDLDPRGANILKQEMLAVGGEAAISYNAICDLSKPTDCLLSGTERQFSIAVCKLKLQPFGLKMLASELDRALGNISAPHVPTLGQLNLDHTLVMGILNVTPDSFSGDGIIDIDGAVKKALQMENEGADIIDIGGESTRPGAIKVSAEDELARVLPVIKNLSTKLKIPISIDSRNASVVKKALESGASIANLVGGLRDAEMTKIIASAGIPVILMHMQGKPDTMQNNPVYDDVMDDIIAELRGQVKTALGAGIKPSNIILDPGIGFGKTAEQNMEIIRRLGEMRILGMPLLVGTSRKSFIGKVSGDANNRLEGSLASAIFASARGANIVRVHDVAETVRALKLNDAIVRN
jgi:dihydropteroate synthase